MMIGRTDTHAPCFGCDKRAQEARKNGAAYLVRQASYYQNRRKRHRSGGKTSRPRKR